MTTKHTPGPWRVHEPGGTVWAGPEGDSTLVANASRGWDGSGNPLPSPDARLIAAAPDLLAALEEAERVILWAVQESRGKVRREIVGGWEHHASRARAAIAAATEAS